MTDKVRVCGQPVGSIAPFEGYSRQELADSVGAIRQVLPDRLPSISIRVLLAYIEHLERDLQSAGADRERLAVAAKALSLRYQCDWLERGFQFRCRQALGMGAWCPVCQTEDALDALAAQPGAQESDDRATTARCSAVSGGPGGGGRRGR